jgi:transcription antitermination protein NusB
MAVPKALAPPWGAGAQILGGRMTAPVAPRRAPAKTTPRRRSRELALQGLYEWLLSAAEPGVIDAHMREQDDFAKCDSAHFDALLHGCIGEADEIDGLLRPSLDRPVGQLSPVEHAALMIGVYELKHCIDVPYRVAINECVELAKSFGGTDGHKFVNGVLDRTAATLRPNEARNAPRRPR